MFRSTPEFPGLMPVLSRGKHRNARKGACFMEFAAYLAGERWSDHPQCTHPLLAELARQVNDHTSDEHRSELIDMVPSVIGLNSDNMIVDVRLALRAARTALPIVSAERQNAMAVSIMTGDRVLALLEDRPLDSSEQASQDALQQAPHAAVWAAGFAARQSTSSRQFRRHSAPNIVRCAVRGIADACVGDPDAVLRELLRGAIGDVAAVCDQEQADAPAAQPESGVTGTAAVRPRR
jgi:hypothetical protein